MNVQYRFVNALNAVSATVRPDQLAQLRAAPEVAGVYPVRKLYPAATVARHLASLGAAARPLAVDGADGDGRTVALLDGPVDSRPLRTCTCRGSRLERGQRQAAGRRRRDPAAAAHGTAMAGIVAGSGGPPGCTASRRAPRCCRSRCMELQHGDLMGTTATLLAGLDRALDPNGDGNLSDHADVILAPVAEPFAALRRLGRDGRRGGRRARRRGARRGGRERRPDRRPLRHDRLARGLAGLARGRRQRRPHRSCRASSVTLTPTASTAR